MMFKYKNYGEYNGKTGWVTAMNKYLGYDYDKILINYEQPKFYSKFFFSTTTNFFAEALPIKLNILCAATLIIPPK